MFMNRPSSNERFSSSAMSDTKITARFKDVCGQDVHRRCFAGRHLDGGDDVINTDLLELRDTCQSGVNVWRLCIRQDDVMSPFFAILSMKNTAQPSRMR